jgi:hypothetical protein
MFLLAGIATREACAVDTAVDTATDWGRPSRWASSLARARADTAAMTLVGGGRQSEGGRSPGTWTGSAVATSPPARSRSLPLGTVPRSGGRGG